MNRFRLKLFSGLPQSIYILLIAQTISGFGNFVAPYLSLYLNDNSRANKDLIGMFISISIISSIPGLIIGGKLSDRYSKKLVIIVSRLLAAICLILVLFIHSIVIKLIFISFFTLFSAVASPPNDSLIADLTPSHQRKQAYSLIYLGYNLGGGIGSLLAGYAFQSYPDIIFIGEAVSIFFAVVLVLLKIKEPKREVSELKVEENKVTSTRNSILILLKQPILAAYMMLSACYAFSYAQNYFCLPLYLESIFFEKSSYYFGILMTVNSICVICCTSFITKITIKFSPMFNIFITGLLYAVGFGMHFVINSFYLFVAATVFWTLGEILFNTNFTVYIVEKSPYDFRGRMISISSLILKAATIINPLVMGHVMKFGNIRIVWLIVFFIMSTTACAMYYISLLEKRHKVVNG